MLRGKQCRFRSVGFFRSQLIWIYTICKSKAYPGSAGQGLIQYHFTHLHSSHTHYHTYEPLQYPSLPLPLPTLTYYEVECKQRYDIPTQPVQIHKPNTPHPHALFYPHLPLLPNYPAIPNSYPCYNTHPNRTIHAYQIIYSILLIRYNKRHNNFEYLL